MTPPPPELRFFAGLWTLRGYPNARAEWTLDEKFAEVKRRGFEGIGGRFLPEAPQLCAKYDLEYILYVDADAGSFKEQLRRAAAFAPRRVNVQLCEHDTAPSEAAQVWAAMVALAEELGLEIDLELHRDTATETPEKALAIADLFRSATGRAVRFSVDYSHFAVTKHLSPPFAPRLLGPRELLAPVRQFHLRPFNGHHAQIPATDGRGGLAPEFQDYLGFLGSLFEAVLSCSSPGEIYYACPENGPVASGYGLSCFPDVWHDAVRVRDEARLLWQARTGADALPAAPSPALP